MATGDRVDPYRNFNFHVEIDGITQAGFSECSGFGASTEPIEYREGGETTTVRKLPGQTKYNNITLKWGLAVDTTLYDWYKDIINGTVERKSGSIILYDLPPNQTEVARWNFFEAWPTKWDGPSFDAKANDVAIETLELVCEKIERA